MTSTLSESTKARRAYDTPLRIVYYALLPVLGAYWYYYASGRAATLSPVDLGLTHLFMFVFAVLLAVCVGRGFTPLRTVLLIVPFALCYFLNARLMMLWADLALAPSASFRALSPIVLGSALLLGTVLAWIALFPFPFQWQTETETGALFRRLEWATVGVLAIGLASLAWYEMATISVLSSNALTPPPEDLWMDIRQNTGRQIQSQVLATYFFLLIKFALRFEFARNSVTASPSTTASISTSR